MCDYCHVVTLEGYNAEQRKYYEQGTKQLHTRERCTEAKNKAGPLPSPPPVAKSAAGGNGSNNALSQQRLQDIKDAQAVRQKQHVELIKNLQWTTKMLAHLVEAQGGREARELLESMGFEEFQEEQRSYENNVI